MNLVPVALSLDQVFGNVEYDIDFYQREYKWNDYLPFKPVTSLLEDIFYRFELEYKPNLDNKPENISKYDWYFLNSFMVNEIDGKVFLVDGQQRLTTLTLIIIKLIYIAKDLQINDQDIIQFMTNSVCGVGPFGKKFWIGFTDRKNALADLLDNGKKTRSAKNVSEENIYANYNVISNYLTAKLINQHKFKAFYLYFFTRIQLIQIKIQKPRDVAMVFEVINDRGIPLTPYEILKGKLLGTINKSDVVTYLKTWEEEISRLQKYDDHVDEFFSTLFRAKYSDSMDQYRRLEVDKYHRTIFMDDFNKKIWLRRNEAKVKQFVSQTMPYYSKLYCDLLSIQSDLKNMPSKTFVYLNSLNDQNSQLLLIMSAVEEKDSDRLKKINLISKLFERNYVILNLTSSYDSRSFSSNIEGLSRKIRNCQLDDIKELFDNHLLETINVINGTNYDTEPFRYNLFQNCGFTTIKSRTFLRYFFARIDTFIGHESKLAFKSYYQMVLQGRGDDVHHIEHIISNNPKNLKLFNDEIEFEYERNRLGALLLIKGVDNDSSNDELYDQKLKTYSGNGTLFAQTLRNDFYKSNPDFKRFITKYKLNFKPYSVFNKNAIEERQMLLFNLVKIIWEV